MPVAKTLIIRILIVSISLSSDIYLFERATIVYEISFVYLRVLYGNFMW